MAVANNTRKASRKARLMAFDMWDKMSKRYSDEREALGPDKDELKQIIAHVRTGAGLTRQAVYKGVPRWFANRQAWTPYIDDVAVRRATAFHLSAWRSLSLDERALVLENLVAQEEPFGPQGGRPGDSVSEAVLRYKDWPASDKLDVLGAYHAQKRKVAA